MKELLTISYTKNSIGALVERLDEQQCRVVKLRAILKDRRDQCLARALENPARVDRVYGEIDKAVRIFVSRKLDQIGFKDQTRFYNTYMRVIDTIMSVFDKVGLKSDRRNHIDVVIRINDKSPRENHELYRGQAGYRDPSALSTSAMLYWNINYGQYGNIYVDVLDEANHVENKLDHAEEMLLMFREHAGSAVKILRYCDDTETVYFPARPLNRCLDDITAMYNLLTNSEDR